MSSTVTRRAFLGSVAGGVALSALGRRSISAWQIHTTGCRDGTERSDRARDGRRRPPGYVAASGVPQARRHAHRGHQRCR